MSTNNKNTRRLPNLVLQEERLAREWTQQEVANLVGTTVVNVSRWERGVTSPNPYFRQKLCHLFEKDAKELGFLVGKPVPQNETSLTSEDGTPDLPEKEFVVTAHEIVSLSLRDRLLGERRTLLVVTSIAIVILLSGSGFLIHSFFFAQTGSLAQGSSHTGIIHTTTLVGNVIARDTFKRANQTFWGTDSDRVPWRGDANILKNFSIVNNTAQIIGGQGRAENALLGATSSDAEVLFSGSLSSFDSSNLGAVLRWKDTNNWYKAYIDGMGLVIQKNVNGTLRYLISTSFPVNAGEFYTIRFRAVGSVLAAKVWLTGNKEPDDWMITAYDKTFTEGFCGLRIQVKTGSIATVNSFVERQAS